MAEVNETYLAEAMKVQKLKGTPKQYIDGLDITETEKAVLYDAAVARVKGRPAKNNPYVVAETPAEIEPVKDETPEKKPAEPRTSDSSTSTGEVTLVEGGTKETLPEVPETPDPEKSEQPVAEKPATTSTKPAGKKVSKTTTSTKPAK